MPDRHTALIGFGQVRHKRSRPSPHAFVYRNFFIWLNMRSLPQQGVTALPRNRWSALSFFDKDHGDGGDNALAWLDALLEANGLGHCKGDAWLHTYPRVWGYTFKPVSFWYCHDEAGQLGAVVAEVNNTFGERHVYVLPHAQLGAPLVAGKAFHVSPFCEVRGEYQFTFMHRDSGLKNHHPSHTVARIAYDDHAISTQRAPTLLTSVSGQLQPLVGASRRRALWRYPLMTLAVMARIHLQAFALWRKRVPFFYKPAPPAVAVTQARPHKKQN